MPHHFSISRKDIERAEHYLKHRKRRHHHRHDPSSKTTSSALHRALSGAEVFGGAMLAGIAKGRYGKDAMTIAKVPADLLVGTLGVLASPWLPLSHHVAHVSMGLAASYGTQLGFGLGDTWAQKADPSGWYTRSNTALQARGALMAKVVSQGTTSAKPQMSGVSSQPISRSDLLSMARAVRSSGRR